MVFTYISKLHESKLRISSTPYYYLPLTPYNALDPRSQTIQCVLLLPTAQSAYIRLLYNRAMIKLANVKLRPPKAPKRRIGDYDFSPAMSPGLDIFGRRTFPDTARYRQI